MLIQDAIFAKDLRWITSKPIKPEKKGENAKEETKKL